MLDLAPGVVGLGGGLPGQQHVCPVDEGLEGDEFNRKQLGLLVAKRVKDERAGL